MATRNPKGPDKDMAQPKMYKSSIDTKKPQPSMNIDTRQKHYQSAKPINFNNKIQEYKPNNSTYKTSFWDAPLKQIKQQRKEKPPKPKPAPPPPAPKKQPPPPRKQPSDSKPTMSSMKPPPGPNFTTKKQPPPPKVQPQPEPVQTRPYVSSVLTEPPQQMEVRYEQWSEPSHQHPDLNPTQQPPVIPTGNQFTMLPSSVGSMSRMFAMFQ